VAAFVPSVVATKTESLMEHRNSTKPGVFKFSRRSKVLLRLCLAACRRRYAVTRIVLGMMCATSTDALRIASLRPQSQPKWS
jgi:hypothetical protein